MSLHVACSILIICNDLLSNNNIEYAHSLLTYFVTTFSELYGNEYISHNVHNLLHMSSDVKNFGFLDSYSAFPFENFLQSLKKLVRKHEKPGPQIEERVCEIDYICKKTAEKISGPFNEHFYEPLVNDTFSPQYSEIRFKAFS